MAGQQIRAHRNHHRQRADQHGWQRRVGQLDAGRQRRVVQQIADQRQFQGGDPVGPVQRCDAALVEQGRHQCDQAERDIACK